MPACRTDTAPSWAQWLLLRRSLSDPTELAFYRAFGPQETTIAELARVAGTRWTIEEGFQRAKAIGLDQYEVRRWDGLVPAHHPLSAGACLPGGDARGAPTGEKGGTSRLIPVTVPEVRRLLAVLLLSPDPATAPAALVPLAPPTSGRRPAQPL